MNRDTTWEIQDCNEAEKEKVYDGILEYNEKYHQIVYRDLSCCIHNKEGEMIAGVVAILKGEYLDLQYLWVDDAYRKEGLGSKLLLEVERRGREEGANVINIETFGFQAPKFYPKHGYELFAETKHCVGAYSRYFYKKEL